MVLCLLRPVLCSLSHGRDAVPTQQRAGAACRGPGRAASRQMSKEAGDQEPSLVLGRADQYLSLSFVAADSARQRLHFALSL